MIRTILNVTVLNSIFIKGQSIPRFYLSSCDMYTYACNYCSLGETAMFGGFVVAGIFIIILVFLLHKTARFTGTRY